jgi:pimeloyl-ACP methyl ester carboxylesterase
MRNPNNQRSDTVSTTSTTEKTTSTLAVPGATLTYDVRRNAASSEPVLMLIGSPMGAGGFDTLAGHFPDRTVVTYDPRGVERSTKDDPSSESTPDQHADDLHRIIGALGGGPIDLFASSGGAVNGLALVARHAEDVRTLVAHEPPAGSALPDHDVVVAACQATRDAYAQHGFGAGMARFIALVSFAGPLPADYADRPAPDPQMFGLPADDDGNRTDPLLWQNIVSSVSYEHDIAALRAGPTRVVLGVSADSPTTIAGRGAAAIAERLGTRPVTFPGGHDGFLGGEYGGMGQPDAFAATLRSVLDGGA